VVEKYANVDSIQTQQMAKMNLWLINNYSQAAIQELELSHGKRQLYITTKWSNNLKQLLPTIKTVVEFYSSTFNMEPLQISHTVNCTDT
jgi:hypothetical protein